MKEIRQYLKPGMICRFVIQDGDKAKSVIGEIIDANGSFIVEKNPTTNRVYFLSVSTIQKISIINDGKNNKEKEQKNKGML